MAKRRMFTNQIIDSDAFLDMPLSTQALYFHLNMKADDDGFINNAKKIMRSIGASQDDMSILIAKRFVIIFENGVVVIKHWFLHNMIRKDRKKDTVYADLYALLEIKNNEVYSVKQPNDNQMTTNYQPNDRIGKDSIGKVSIVYKYIEQNETENDTLKNQNEPQTDTTINEIDTKLIQIDTLFNDFWKAYPKKIGKAKCLSWFKTHKPKPETVEIMLEKIKEYKQTKQWQNEQYIPHPYTWLNQGRWEDELEIKNENSSEWERIKNKITSIGGN